MHLEWILAVGLWFIIGRLSIETRRKVVRMYIDPLRATDYLPSLLWEPTEWVELLLGPISYVRWRVVRHQVVAGCRARQRASRLIVH